MYGSRSFADAICQAGIERQKNYQTQNRREGMSNKDQPAFSQSRLHKNSYTNEWEGGLTKREYFAGLAMQAVISGHLESAIATARATGKSEEEVVSIVSLGYADALLAELEKTA